MFGCSCSAKWVWWFIEEGRFQLVFVSGRHKAPTPRWKDSEKLYLAILSPSESFKPLGFWRSTQKTAEVSISSGRWPQGSSIWEYFCALLNPACCVIGFVGVQGRRHWSLSLLPHCLFSITCMFGSCLLLCGSMECCVDIVLLTWDFSTLVRNALRGDGWLESTLDLFVWIN